MSEAKKRFYNAMPPISLCLIGITRAGEQGALKVSLQKYILIFINTMKLEKHFRWPQHELAYVGLFFFGLLSTYTLYSAATNLEPALGYKNWFDYFCGVIIGCSAFSIFFCSFIYTPFFMGLYKAVYGEKEYGYWGRFPALNGCLFGFIFFLLSEQFLEKTKPSIKSHEQMIWHAHVLKWLIGWAWFFAIILLIISYNFDNWLK